jgi:hypothetical protein
MVSQIESMLALVKQQLQDRDEEIQRLQRHVNDAVEVSCKRDSSD